MRSLLQQSTSAAVAWTVCGPLAPHAELCTATVARSLSALVLAVACLVAHATLRRSPFRPSLTFLATSWSILVIGTRPFSNTTETAALAAFASLSYTMARARPSARPTYAAALGAAAVLASWLRFTFPAFGIVPGLLALGAGASRRPLRAIAAELAAAAVGAVTSLACLSLVEGWLYGLPGPVFPPFAAVAYNRQTDLLALHGLHPWYTHTMHLPLIAGPVLAYAALVGAVTTWRTAATKVLVVSILVPLAVLSAAPHAEPRFLLPLLLPLASLAAKQHRVSPTSPLAILVTLALVTFYGVLHQGGVVPAVRWLSDQVEARGGGPMRVLSIRNYYPPVSMAARPTLTFMHTSDVPDEPCDHNVSFVMAATPLVEATPSLAALPLAHTIAPHFSGEDLPTSLHSLSLSILECPRATAQPE